MCHGHLGCFSKRPLGGSRPNKKPGDHGTPNAHKHCFILFYHVCGSTWIEVPWNNIWFKVRSHITSHSTWESVTKPHDIGRVLERPLDTFFWAPTLSWLRLLARVWSGPKCMACTMHHVQYHIRYMSISCLRVGKAKAEEVRANWVVDPHVIKLLFVLTM
jgi:hypothetical protein